MYIDLLLVPSSVYTTFYVGIFNNKPDNNASSCSKPHLEVYFTVSYGLSRDKLEELNFLIKSSSPMQNKEEVSQMMLLFYTGIDSSPLAKQLPYSVTLHADVKPPAVYLRKPLLADLYGAGFTKSFDGEVRVSSPCLIIC